jgi:hypothetical protein
MEDSGEHLVGQYLKEVKKCDFVEYNIQTGDKQGEIDVIGIKLSKDKSQNIIYICEVAIHLGGLLYVNPKSGKSANEDKIRDKFQKAINYARLRYVNCKLVFMFWTPIITGSNKKQVSEKIGALTNVFEIIKKENKFDFEIELICNKTFLDKIKELRELISKDKKSTVRNSQIMRFIQIEEALKKRFEK